MGVLLGLIILCGGMYLLLVMIFSWVAYSEGKWDSQRYSKAYHNMYWMPMTYFYERGFAKYGDSNLKSTEDKNRERFGRE